MLQRIPKYRFKREKTNAACFIEFCEQKRTLEHVAFGRSSPETRTVVFKPRVRV